MQPEKTRFLIAAFLLVISHVTVQAAAPAPFAISQMIADWQRAREYTKEYLDAMPADGVNYKPNADVRSFGEQMLHIASGNFAFVAAASGKANPYQGKNLEKMEEFKSKEALSKIVLESYDFAINALKGASETQMGGKIKLFGQEMTGEQAYFKAFEHQTHHRGQTTLYLRMKGVKPPAEKLF
jgi:uncharacterized damage-inducible protein DinB